MKKALGVLAATVVTPLSIGVAFLLLGAARLGWFADKDWRLILANVLMYSYFAVPIAIVVSAAMGLPVAGYLARRARTRATHFLLAGAIMGVVPFLAFDIFAVVSELLSAHRNWPDNEFLGVHGTTERLLASLPVAANWLALGAWCGAWSSFAYWLVVHRGSPSNFPFQPTDPAVTPPAEQASRQPSGG